MKILKTKIEGKEWTLKVDENQIIPETDSTFKTAILILELGQLYYDVDKRIFYLKPPKKINKVSGNIRIPFILYKSGFAFFNLNKGLTNFDITIMWSWDKIDPRDEVLSDPAKYFILAHSFCLSQPKLFTFPLCDPTLLKLLANETYEERINYLKYIEGMKVDERQVLSGLANYIKRFGKSEELKEIFGEKLYKAAQKRLTNVNNGVRTILYDGNYEHIKL